MAPNKPPTEFFYLIISMLRKHGSLDRIGIVDKIDLHNVILLASEKLLDFHPATANFQANNCKFA